MTELLAKFLPWLDLFWIPLALIVVHPEQRIKTILFIVTCVLILRLQIEMMDQIGFPRGIFGFWHWPLLYRGMAGYGVFIAFFLLTARFSPKTDLFVLLAAIITLFIGAFCVTSLMMVI